jgi:deoxyguanosine kinase
MAKKKHRFIAVAGVLGSGKTTAVKLIADSLGYEVLEENVAGNQFLPLFYKNPKRWALASQLFYLQERFSQIEKVERSIRKNGLVLDGPVQSDYEMYTKALHRLGHITDSELALYEKYFRKLETTFPVPDLILHLQVPVPTILKRVKMRGRSFEKDIDTSYLSLLSKLQTTWLKAHRASPVLNINTEKLDLAKDPEHKEKFIRSVMQHIEKLPA